MRKKLVKQSECQNCDEKFGCSCIADADFEEDFIKSDYCGECSGQGFTEERHQAPYGSEKFQCETCEELHQSEIRADRMCDEMKGN